MIPTRLSDFHAIYIVDTEYVATAGEPYDPVALGIMAYGSEAVRVYRRDDLLQWDALPFPTGPDVLTVCYNAAAEAGFLHVLGLDMAVHWVDLMAESRAQRNVCIPRRQLAMFEKRHPEVFRPNRDISLLETAALFGVEGGDAGVKDAGRDLILSRAWASGDVQVWQQIEDYCRSDVLLTARLLAKMEPHLDLRAALIRGRYAAEHGLAAAAVSKPTVA
jgi:hypothetical protein